jgi:hypothetical protein
VTAAGDNPIACSLSAAELPARLEAMAALGRDALDSAEVTGLRAVLRFRRTVPDVSDRLDAIVAAEAECCRFLDMRVREDADVLVLTIIAPEAAAPVLEQLVAAFRG